MYETYTSNPEGKRIVVDRPQSRILRAAAEADKFAVRACHGVGKTTCVAWLSHWWLSTRCPSLVVTLAGTWNHLEDKLWPEIHQWGRLWRLREAFVWQTLGIYAKNNPDGWRAEASSSDRAENVEGWHSPNLAVFIDEAKALPDEVYVAIRGALTSVSATGAKPKMGVFSTPPPTPAGWYVSLFGAKAEGWETVHITAHESTRVSKEYVTEMARDFGEDSATYQSKVMGNIPEAAAEAVIRTGWIEAAQEIEFPPDRRGVALSLDVARDGEDLSVLGKIEHARFDFVKWAAHNELMELVGWCVEAATDLAARVLTLDDTGLGGGVTDRLMELQREDVFPRKCRIVPVRFGAAAHRAKRFHSIKDEMWWVARDMLRGQQPVDPEHHDVDPVGLVATTPLIALPSDHELAAQQFPRGSNLKAQLAAPIYEQDSQSRIRVLDKRVGNREETRALPIKSPDLAHCLILGVWGWRTLRDDVEPEPAKTTTEIQKRRRVEILQREHKKRGNLYRRRH